MTRDNVIDAYLDEVAAALPGPTKARADIAAELRSGLLDAFDAHQAAGLTEYTAAEAAIDEFGDPTRVAASFYPELTVKQARRLAIALAASAAPVGLLWIAAAQASHPGSRDTKPWQWINLLPVPLPAAALVIAVSMALATVVATGRMTRWLPNRPHIAPKIAATTAAVGGFGAAATDLAIFAMLAHELIIEPGSLAPGPVTAAAIATLIRLTFAHRTAQHCLTARAALT